MWLINFYLADKKFSAIRNLADRTIGQTLGNKQRIYYLWRQDGH